MSVLTQASRQWMRRPVDERFASLSEMAEKMGGLRNRSRSFIEITRDIEVVVAAMLGDLAAPAVVDRAAIGGGAAALGPLPGRTDRRKPADWAARGRMAEQRNAAGTAPWRTPQAKPMQSVLVRPGRNSCGARPNTES